MKLPDNATLEHAATLAATLPAAVAEVGKAGSGVLHIDASALKTYDSSTIALLMQARRLAQAAGCGFSVDQVPTQLAQLARLYGVEELLSLSGPRPLPGHGASATA
jgi:phospholipid transport system transporter-binding protein